MRLLLTVFICLLILSSGKFETIQFNEYLRDQIQITVHGEVKKQGLVYIKPYATIDDLLHEVGLTENADISRINLATILKDKDTLTIPSIDTSNTISNTISINTADVEGLMQIQGIGKKIAQAIVDYRKEHGLFQNIEDIMKIKGIGKSKFEKIKDDICL